MVNVTERREEEKAQSERTADLERLTQDFFPIFEVHRGVIRYHLHVRNSAIAPSSQEKIFPLSIDTNNNLIYVNGPEADWLNLAVDIARMYEKERSHYGEWTVKKDYDENR